MISDFEKLPKREDIPRTITRHHEDNDSFESRVSNDLKQVVAGVSSNPFNFPNLTAIRNTNVTFSEVGEEKFLRFWDERFTQIKIPIDAAIRNNKFKLPGGHK